MPPVGDVDQAVSDWLVLALRAYSEPASLSASNWEPKPQPAPSSWVLVFDCETTTTPDQKLRFGVYQLRYEGRMWERGVFYDPAGLTRKEIKILKAIMLRETPTIDGERIFLRTRWAFVEKVLHEQAFLVGAQIVGFNLPFDIARLAIGHVNARANMKGGFSFKIQKNRRRPRIAIKHLSARLSFIQFKGASTGKQDEGEPKREPDRGHFVDLKTLAAALTSGSHSLASLAKLLGVPTQKRATDEHGATLTADYVRYAQADVQATWECFAVLARRVADFNLPDLQLSKLYSEASLGKAHLKAMGIRTWREVQPDFPRQQIGQIMSAYFGGRAEVHIRREIVEVIHCDFLSMYPTVCTLMGLWEFVVAQSVTWSDATEEIRDLVRNITPDDLKTKAMWRNLVTLVQIAPAFDVLPVRAHYGDGPSPNIGLNHLSSDEPLWFTLADVIAAKLLSGKSPEILQAVRYAPGKRQAGLKPVTIAGKRFDPADPSADFYRDLIDHRSLVKHREASATSTEEKAALNAEQKSIKTLANATAYGIFMELNVEDRSKPGHMLAFGARDRSLAFKSTTIEKPGRYFHPLLGATITGAARLMLAMAERQVIHQGLDWAFCDTDSIAIANTRGLPRAEFLKKAEAVQAWFADLNPYQQPGPILKIEDVNYAESDGAEPTPLYCLAISAKRYVQFNRDANGEPVIRKASGHGLGHLMDPYEDPPEVTAEWMKRVNAPRWQADVWREIIKATDAGHPDVVPLAHLKGFNSPARSQFGASSPELLSWFDGYNEGRAYEDQVRPFNFLLSLQLRSDIDLASEDLDALRARGKAKAPRPAAPFTRDAAPEKLAPFDRKTSAPIDTELLKTLARSLVRYHLHSEAKFIGGEDDSIGILQRRHVQAIAIQSIGKEADELEERQFLGEGDADITHPLADTDLGRLFAHAWALQDALNVSDRDLTARAQISHHRLSALRRCGGPADVAMRLVQAMEAFRKEHAAQREEADAILVEANKLSLALGGPAALGREIGKSRQYVGRILKGERPVSDEFAREISRLLAAQAKASTPEVAS